MCGALWGQTEYRHHLLVELSPRSLEQLHEIIRLDKFDFVPGPTREAVLALAYPEDLVTLNAMNCPYEIIHEDMEKFLAERIGSRLDDMGGYHTLDEIVAELDSMHTHYPEICTEKFSIGQSIEGREIWCVKISDNPEIDENEPEVFYNSLIHAREPACMEVVLYFMNHLLSNYGMDPEVTRLINTRELFFVPCFNPDGYVYNETIEPGGGGMWRKNRRNNGAGNYGVDLNRNFGYTWGLDNVGSSPNPWSQTYRGTGPFSEPETQAIRNFMKLHSFVCALNYHTYSNFVVYPWGTSGFEGTGLTEDNDTFVMIADSMSYFIEQVNGVHYDTGPAWQLLYDVNGDANDDMYGDQVTKPKIFSVLTEVGSYADNFWPPPERILPLCEENLPANMFLARIVGPLSLPTQEISWAGQCQSENSGDGDGFVEPGENLSLQITLQNTGLETWNDLHGTLSTSDSLAQVSSNESDWPTIPSVESAENLTEFQVLISPSCPQNYLLPFELHLTASGLDTTLDITAQVGFVTFSDDVESGPGNWTTPGEDNLWHVSIRRYQSPEHSWYCGHDGSGICNNDMNVSLVSEPITLPPNAILSWHHYFQFETGHDFGYVEISDGSGWKQLDAFTGLSSPSWEWLQETRTLADYCAGSVVQIRFRVVTDMAGISEGWFLDNISISAPPARTVGLVAFASGGDVHLSWWSAVGATEYRVEWAPTSWGPFSLLETVTDTTYVHGEAALWGHIGYYRVVATN